MKHISPLGARLLSVAAGLILSSGPVHGQRVLEEWRVRPSAGADALVAGAAAVFWNPAQLARITGRGEAQLLDLRSSSVLGVSGVAAVGGLHLDARTTVGAGIEHVGIDEIEETSTSPEGLGTFNVGETRLGAAAARQLSERASVGAMVQYTRLPEFSRDGSVLALGAGLRVQPLGRVPLHVAGAAATEGDEAWWSAGAEYTPAAMAGMRGVALSAEYGVAGGQLAPGLTHRLAGSAGWRDAVRVTVGAVLEPNGESTSLQPVLGGWLRLNRYRVSVVREQLPNDFGGAWSFAFALEW